MSLIEKEKAIDALSKQGLITAMIVIDRMPPAQPELYGYSVEHLAIIAMVLRRENLSPERVAEMLSDVGRIIDIVCDEFEEQLRKTVERTVI